MYNLNRYIYFHLYIKKLDISSKSKQQTNKLSDDITK